MIRSLVFVLALASSALSQTPECPHQVAKTVAGQVITGTWKPCGTPTIIVDGQTIGTDKSGCPEFILVIPPTEIVVPMPGANTKVVRSGRSPIEKITFECVEERNLFFGPTGHCKRKDHSIVAALDRHATVACNAGGN